MIQFIHKVYRVIAVIVNLYALVQIFLTTHFKIPDVFESAWFWLIIIVSLSASILFTFFKFEEFKLNRQVEKQEFMNYKQRVSDEIYKRSIEINEVNKKCDSQHWRIIELEQKIAELQKNSYFPVSN